MKKVFLLSLVLALIGATVLPTVAAPKPAQAWSGTVTCDPGELYFRVYAGVPTYLLGFIPLDDGQTLTLTHEDGNWWDGTIAGWTVTDDAGWLNEVNGDFQIVTFGTISGDSQSDVIVRVNTDGMVAGTYTATITFRFTTCATTTITIPVTVEVIDPMVLGPIGIGADKDLLKGISGAELITEENEYGGLTVQLLTNPDDAMDMQAIETDGCWDLVLQCGEEVPNRGIPLIGGTLLNIQGETITIKGGSIVSMGKLMSLMGSGSSLPIPADFDWGDNYAAMMSTTSGSYIGLILGDIGKLLDLMPALLPMIGDMFPEEAPDGTDLEGPPGATSTGNTNDPSASADVVVPLAPILSLMPTLMPVMVDLLSNETLINVLKPLMGLLPPIIIVMPLNLMKLLFSSF